MSDLRAKVEGLRGYPIAERDGWERNPAGPFVLLDEALELIPEGAVLVTEEELAVALWDVEWPNVDAPDSIHDLAVRVLARLVEMASIP